MTVFVYMYIRICVNVVFHVRPYRYIYREGRKKRDLPPWCLAESSEGSRPAEHSGRPNCNCTYRYTGYPIDRARIKTTGRTDPTRKSENPGICMPQCSETCDNDETRKPRLTFTVNCMSGYVWSLNYLGDSNFR